MITFSPAVDVSFSPIVVAGIVGVPDSAGLTFVFGDPDSTSGSCLCGPVRSARNSIDPPNGLNGMFVGLLFAISF